MTSEVKFTPGPWFAYGRYIGTKNHKSAIAECRDVNGNWSDDAKSSADAKLIASAPDLLAELEVRAGDLVMLIKAIEAGDPKAELLLRANDMLRETRAAISKATA